MSNKAGSQNESSNLSKNESRKDKVTRIFNSFDPSKPELLMELYAASAEFQDPVTKVKGRDQIKAYYEKAYRQVKSIKFNFGTMTEAGDSMWAPWVMELTVSSLNGGKPYKVEGVSYLKFNSDNQLVQHRDYLDLGEMVYERIPLVGRLVSGLKKMLDHQR